MILPPAGESQNVNDEVEIHLAGESEQDEMEDGATSKLDESVQTLLTARDVWIPALTDSIDTVLHHMGQTASAANPDIKEGGYLPIILRVLGMLAGRPRGTKTIR